MKPILTSEQTRKVDQFTIENKPVPSIELMENASEAFCEKFMELFNPEKTIIVVCGTGNNGGDGLAVARILASKKYSVKVYYIGDLDRSSPDFRTNFDRLGIKPTLISRIEDLIIENNSIVIDAIFGSGLTRAVEGLRREVIEKINNTADKIVSIDIASGLFDNKYPESEAIIQPDHTITFQFPKLSFFQPALHKYVEELHIVDIGLISEYTNHLLVEHFLSESDDFRGKIAKKEKFSHKGSSGRCLLITGSKGKIGAGILASKAALRSGVGLLFVEMPEVGHVSLHSAVLEAMSIGNGTNHIENKIVVSDDVVVVGIGPGIGTGVDTEKVFIELLENFPQGRRLVIDADGLNLLAKNDFLFSKLPPETILTPHPGEFKRLVGPWKDDFEKLEKLRNICRTYRLNIVLKGAYSAVCNSEGKIFFNPSGNPGMATAGSGDVLFGMICGLLCQKIKADNVLKFAVYIHGHAGDLATKQVGETSMIASDIVEKIPEALASTEI